MGTVVDKVRLVAVVALATAAVALTLNGQGRTGPTPAEGVSLTGELKRWHKVTLTLDGPSTTETATPNPFLDLRMDVTFSHPASGLTYRVPGYFAADGNAANTSATQGNKWRAHLSPDHGGEWTYRIAFRQGPGVAVADAPTAGTALAPFDGRTGSFTIAETDKTGRDFRAKGRLAYVNWHYLRYAGSGEYFLRVGSDSPENLFAYDDFDNTPNYTWVSENAGRGGGFRRDYAPHVQDWKSGDPTWKDGKGKGLIGAMNYLAAKGLNGMSWMPYTTHGDDRNVSMYVNDEDRTRIDISKVGQWEIVHEHLDRLGLFQDVKMLEAESSWDHDRGELGPERRLYYREMIARFAHHLGMMWNIGEENETPRKNRMDWAGYIAATDPYKHLIVIHGHSADWDTMYQPLMGAKSPYTGASLQLPFYDNFEIIRYFRLATAALGKPWVLTLDETRPNAAGRAAGLPDATPPDELDPSHNEVRKGGLWSSLMAGGAGTNTYFGYGSSQGGDVNFRSFHPWSEWWNQKRYAHDFFLGNHIPFHQMSSENWRMPSRGGWAFAGANTLVVYLPNGLRTAGPGGGSSLGLWLPPDHPDQAGLTRPGHGKPNPEPGGWASFSPDETPGVFVDLSGFTPGAYEVGWFDPRRGGPLQKGSITTLRWDGEALKREHVLKLGDPPREPDRDWAVLIRRPE